MKYRDLETGEVLNEDDFQTIQPIKGEEGFEEQGFLERSFVQPVREAFKDIDDIYTGAEESIKQGVPRAAVFPQKIAQVGIRAAQLPLVDIPFSFGFNVIKKATEWGFDALVPLKRERQLKEFGEKVLKSEPIQTFIKGIDVTSENWGRFREDMPVLARNIEAAGRLALIIPAAESLAKVGKVIPKVTKGLVEKLPKPFSTSIIEGEKLDNYIAKTIEKAVKPSVAVKATAEEAIKFNKSAVDVVKDIVRRSSELKLPLPQSLGEFSEILGKGKKAVYKQYTDLAGKEIEVDSSNIINELNKIVASESLAISSPKTQKYAKEMIARLQEKGFVFNQSIEGGPASVSFVKPIGIKGSVAQDLVEQFNSELKAYYRGRSFRKTGDVYVDAMVNNLLRENLNKAILSSVEGKLDPTYQQLRSLYGSYASLEKEASRRAVVYGRRNIKGFFDLAGIFGSADVLAGITSGNVTQVAKGGIIKGLVEYTKWLNSPDVQIRRMFQTVQKSLK